MINLSEMKLDEIKNTFDVDINGEVQEIVIYNLLGEEREKLKNKIKELSSQGKEGLELTEEIYTDVLLECTNIAIDDEVIDVLNAPSGNMLRVMQEVYDIIHEIEIEGSMESYQNLCQMESLEYMQLNLLKAQHIELLSKERVKVEKEIEKFQKAVKKNGVQ